MASPTQRTWVWVNSGSWWWTGRPGVLQSMGLQRVGHDRVTELNWRALNHCSYAYHSSKHRTASNGTLFQSASRSLDITLTVLVGFLEVRYKISHICLITFLFADMKSAISPRRLDFFQWEMIFPDHNFVPKGCFINSTKKYIMHIYIYMYIKSKISSESNSNQSL